QEIVPGANDLALMDGLRTIRIPELEHGGLPEYVGGARTRRMQRVALDLRRPSHVGFHEHAHPVAIMRKHRRIEHRFGVCLLSGPVTIGNDRLGMLARAAWHAGEREGSSHKPQELAAIMHRCPNHLRSGRLVETLCFGDASPEALVRHAGSADRASRNVSRGLGGHRALTMTGRAIGELARRAQLVRFAQLGAAHELVAWRAPVDVEYAV